MWGDPAQTAALHSEFATPWDLVLGSDLLYDPDQYPALVHSLCELVGEDTLALLGFPHRHGGEQRFLQLMSCAASGAFELRTEWRAAEGDASKWAVVKIRRTKGEGGEAVLPNLACV